MFDGDWKNSNARYRRGYISPEAAGYRSKWQCECLRLQPWGQVKLTGNVKVAGTPGRCLSSISMMHMLSSLSLGICIQRGIRVCINMFSVYYTHA
jgi:hypothetical protein